jgi:hypothetical protein
MQAYSINVTEIEELQTIRNVTALENIFARAKATIVNGEEVNLLRRFADGRTERFDTLTTLDDLETYRKQVFKYL